MADTSIREQDAKAAAEKAKAAAESGERPEATPTTFAEPPDEQVDVGAAQKSGGFVQFTGHNGERIISEDDWKALSEATSQSEGFGKAGTNVWNHLNAWRVPASEFSQAQLNYLLNVDGEFTLAEE